MSVLDPTFDFVRECLRNYFDAFTAKLEGAPPEVQAELGAEFRLSETAIDPAPLKALEATLPAKLPPELHSYLTIGYFPGVEAYEYYLPSVSQPDPLSHIKDFLLCRELWPLGYIQFGHGPCGDPLCFDIALRSKSGGYPVLSFNHDLAPKEAWASRPALQPYGRVVASSFRTLLQGLCYQESGPPPWSAAA
jgi:SMI1/KNR4 family protein SUKH-1